LRMTREPSPCHLFVFILPKMWYNIKKRKGFCIMTPEILLENSPISREPGDFPTLAYYGWPSVTVDENGVTYVVCSKRLRHIDPYGKVMLYKSFDQGASWSEGLCLIDTVLDDRDAGILYLGGRHFVVTTFSHTASLYLENANASWTKWQQDVGADEAERRRSLWAGCSDADLTGRSSYIITNDYFATWGAQRMIPITAPHGPMLLAGGELLYVGVPFHAEFAGGKALSPGVYCFISRDCGESWQQHSEISVDARFGACEAHGVQLRDGSIVVSLRTADFHTLTCRSLDGGLTWTAPQDLTYGAPAHLLQLADDSVLITYSKRADVTGQCARRSTDGGVSWSEEFYISRPNSETDFDLGYPATAQYADGSLITVYYQKFGSDRKPSLMRTVWRGIFE